MIRLIDNTTSSEFELADDFKITLEINLDVFDMDAAKTSVSYPFNLSRKSRVNKRILDQTQSLGSTRPANKERPVTLFIGNFSTQATLVVRNITVENFVTNVKMNLSAVSTYINDTSLRKAKYDQIDIYEYNEWVEWQKDDPVPAPRTITWIINGISYPVLYDTNTMTTKDFNIAMAAAINADTANNKVTASEYTFGGFEFFRLDAVEQGIDKLWNLIDQVGIAGANPEYIESDSNISYSHQYDAILSYLNNATDLSYSENKICFPIIKNPDFYGSKNSAFGGYLNYYFNGEYQRNTGSMSVTTKKYSIVPFVTLQHVLHQLFTVKNGFNITGRFYFDEEIRTLIFYNNYAKDQLTTHSVYEQKLNVFNGIINIGDHLPDIKISQLISELRKKFALFINLDGSNQELLIKPIADIVNDFRYEDYSSIIDPSTFEISVPDNNGVRLSATNDSSDELISERLPGIEELTKGDPVNDVGDLPDNDAASVIRLVNSLNQYYISRRDNAGGTTVTWEFYSDNLYDYVEGDGSLGVTTAIATTLMTSEEDLINDDRDFTVPSVKQKGSSTAYDLGDSKFTPRFLFYRGMQEDSEGDNYPMASNDVYDHSGSVIGNYSLRWDGENGLVKKWWGPALAARKRARPGSAIAYLDARQILQPKPELKKRYADQELLLRKIVVDIDKTKIYPAKIEFWKI